jgi:hypothetical protein
VGGVGHEGFQFGVQEGFVLEVCALQVTVPGFQFLVKGSIGCTISQYVSLNGTRCEPPLISLNSVWKFGFPSSHVIHGPLP